MRDLKTYVQEALEECLKNINSSGGGEAYWSGKRDAFLEVLKKMETYDE